MASLIERLRAALAPEYEVEHELAAGGMGVVFLARDVALDRRVAIKVLLPMLATEDAAQRFLREARILARLSHSHIIPVHRVGEAAGLFYYVMEYVAGETIADVLERGPLSVDDSLKLGRDMLDALEVVHQEGIVHRDIKPANVFLRGRRALLGDFGIAKPPTGTEETLTQTGGVLGTPHYMPPEQVTGLAVTAQTDLYAVAMVLYEAMTGRRWRAGEDPGHADWSGVPRRVMRVLRTALAFLPEDRWPDAATFRRRLWHTRVRRYQWRTAGLTAAGLLVGAVVARWWPPGEPGTPGALVVRLQPFRSMGADTLGLADAVTTLVVDGLGQGTDFRVCDVGRPCEDATVVLRGTVRVADTSLTVVVESDDGTEYANREGLVDRWAVVASLVSSDILRVLFSRSSPLAEWLPLDALPKTGVGFDRWLEAERLFNAAHWGDARDAYEAAWRRDSTCLLCSWRITEIDRQRPGAGLDTTHVLLVLERRDGFPEHYQPLIDLEMQEFPRSRIAILDSAVAIWRLFPYLQFRLGEELFNRGPLAGRLRREARIPLQQATARRSDFGAAWEHLAWLEISLGEQDRAMRALDSLNRLPEAEDAYSRAYRGLISIGAGYRFGGGPGGNEAAGRALGDEEILQIPELAAAPRLMPSFDAPNGAIQFGGMFVQMGPTVNRDDLVLSGLLAQMFGYLATGQLDEYRDCVRRVRMASPEDDEFWLFATQLEAFLVVFDSTGSGVDAHSVIGDLRPFTSPPFTDMQQKRAAWTLALLARRVAPDAAESYVKLVGDDPAKGPLASMLHADSLAVAGTAVGLDTALLDAALEVAGNLRRWERAKYVPTAVGPFFRTALHLLRAEWNVARENLVAARDELRWHEGWDQAGLPMDEPRVEEVDWAFGTLARWRRAMILEQLDDASGELCDAYDDIVRLWSSGDSVYAARADSARQAFQRHACAGTTER